jgi:hypothetical protein
MLNGLSDEEAALITSLVSHHVRFMVVGMSAAILQNAPGVTQDVDLWFDVGQVDELSAACERVGATYYWRANPPKIEGPGIDQVDVVWNCQGLGTFKREYAGAADVELAPGLTVKVLPLDRIIASKKAAGRLKDKAVLPMLREVVRTLKKLNR